MSADIRELLDDLGLEHSSSWTLTYLPIALTLIAGTLLLGGLYAWLFGRVPGLGATRSAIDWSATSDAVARLLAVGCTYPEAFRVAGDVTRSRAGRAWLQDSVKRIEQGGAEIAITPTRSGDPAILELLIEAGEGEPQRRWAVASNHFFAVAQQRLALLLSATPFLSTIVSGLLIWLAISATLGPMWQAVTEMLRGFW
jgi:hypothetical protein